MGCHPYRNNLTIARGGKLMGVLLVYLMVRFGPEKKKREKRKRKLREKRQDPKKV